MLRRCGSFGHAEELGCASGIGRCGLVFLQNQEFRTMGLDFRWKWSEASDSGAPFFEDGA